MGLQLNRLQQHCDARQQTKKSGHVAQHRSVRAVRKSNAERDTNKFEDRYQRRIIKIDGSEQKIADGARSRRDYLQHHSGADGRQWSKSTDQHDRNRK